MFEYGADYGHGNAGSSVTVTASFARTVVGDPVSDLPILVYGPVRRKRTILPNVSDADQPLPGNRYRDRDTLRHAADVTRRVSRALNDGPSRSVAVRAIVAQVRAIPEHGAGAVNIATSRGERVTVPGTAGLLSRLDSTTNPRKIRRLERRIAALDRDVLCGRSVPGRNGRC